MCIQRAILQKVLFRRIIKKNRKIRPFFRNYLYFCMKKTTQSLCYENNLATYPLLPANRFTGRH